MGRSVEGVGVGRAHDLLISDVGLPSDMNGRQVADVARVAWPNLKVLFITSYAENDCSATAIWTPVYMCLPSRLNLETPARRAKELIESA